MTIIINNNKIIIIIDNSNCICSPDRDKSVRKVMHMKQIFTKARQLANNSHSQSFRRGPGP